MKQKTRFKSLENIGYRYQLSLWPIYRYRPKKNISVNL